MFELPSAIFLIADGNEFRFARFYIVCEEVPLGTPESPLIVCGLSDTLRECPNVAKTRNGMPATAWKKYTNFASKNLPPSVYSGTFLFSGIPVILLIPQRGLCLLRQFHAADRLHSRLLSRRFDLCQCRLSCHEHIVICHIRLCRIRQSIILAAR